MSNENNDLVTDALSTPTPRVNTNKEWYIDDRQRLVTPGFAEPPSAIQIQPPYYVDPHKGSASDRLGAINKAQWEHYKTKFVPIEDRLMNMTTYGNPALAKQEIYSAQADAGATYDNIAGASAVQLGRYGMTRTADQQASSDRLNALGRSGAVVDAANNIRLKLVERNQMVASGSAPASMVKQG